MTSSGRSRADAIPERPARGVVRLHPEVELLDALGLQRRGAAVYQLTAKSLLAESDRDRDVVQVTATAVVTGEGNTGQRPGVGECDETAPRIAPEILRNRFRAVCVAQADS